MTGRLRIPLRWYHSTLRGGWVPEFSPDAHSYARMCSAASRSTDARSARAQRRDDAALIEVGEALCDLADRRIAAFAARHPDLDAILGDVLDANGLRRGHDVELPSTVASPVPFYHPSRSSRGDSR